MSDTFKCPKCKCIKEKTEFGLNRKDERRKTCNICFKYLQDYQKSKKKIEFDLKDNKEWKEHPEYKNYYASRSGLVVNSKTKRVIGTLENDGYIRLGLYVNDKQKNIYAHRFIFETFVGKIPDDKVINHKNEIKNDNAIKNLEVVTLSENAKKSTKLTELCKEGQHKPRKCIGHKVDDKVKIYKFKSLRDAERKTGICQVSIQSICDGATNSAASKTDNTKWIFAYYN